MQRIMQILHDDHINVARLLDLMERELEQIRAGRLAGIDVVLNAMRYMTAYPDLYHHPTEDIVFQQLMARAAETQSVVERLLDEHQIIGRSGGEFLHQLKTVISQECEPPQDLVKSGLEYVAQLRDHMNTEEGEIFPLAKVVLSLHDWEILDDKIAATDDPLFGTNLQKSYQDLAKELTDSD